MVTKLQKFSRKRNFNKMRIKGMIASIQEMISSKEFTMQEKTQLLKIVKSLKNIEKDWDVSWIILKTIHKFN